MRAVSICALAATVAFQFNCGGDDRITEFTFQARLFPIPGGATVTIDGTTVSDSDGELILDRMYPDYTMARADTIDIEVVDEGRRVAGSIHPGVCFTLCAYCDFEPTIEKVDYQISFDSPLNDRSAGCFECTDGIVDVHACP